MKEMVIDGVTFVPREQGNEPIKIVVLERGFVYVGCVHPEDDGLVIHNARSLIRWGTTKHLGELVNGPLANTKLGDRCTVRARYQQVIHTIEVSQHAWNTHVNG